MNNHLYKIGQKVRHKLSGRDFYAWVDQEWVKQDLKLVTARWLASHEVRLIDLHTAIAQYESNNYQETSHCNNSGNYEKRFNSSEVIKQLESDHITDIRNHISPNTKVINHG